MSTEVKVTQLIVQLNRETAAGKIQWKATQPPASLVQGTEDVVHYFFEGEYKGKLIGIYERRYKSFFDEHDFYWNNEIVLAILNNRHQRKIIWEFSERTPALIDLYSTIREQCSGINELLDDLLK